MSSAVPIHYLPSPILSPYVDCYWILEPAAGTPPEQQRIPADGRAELIFNFGAASQRESMDQNEFCEIGAASFIMGTRDKAYTLDHRGAPIYVAVRFRPGGLSAFSSLSMAEINNLHTELDDLWGFQVTRDIEAQLESAGSHRAKVNLLEAVLMRYFNPPDHLERILYAIQKIEDQTVESMPDLAADLNLSQKHFERLFHRYVGFRPSLFTRISRFQRVIYTVMKHPRASIPLGALASQAGYYDQAHFNRDFKAFSGFTPNAVALEQANYARINAAAQLVEKIQYGD